MIFNILINITFIFIIIIIIIIIFSACSCYLIPLVSFFIFENNDDMKRLAKEKKWGITLEISDYIHFNVNTKKCVILTQRYSLS